MLIKIGAIIPDVFINAPPPQSLLWFRQSWLRTTLGFFVVSILSYLMLANLMRHFFNHHTTTVNIVGFLPAYDDSSDFFRIQKENINPYFTLYPTPRYTTTKFKTIYHPDNRGPWTELAAEESALCACYRRWFAGHHILETK